MGDLKFPPQDKQVEAVEFPGWAKLAAGTIIVLTILITVYMSAYLIGLGLLRSGVVKPTDQLNVKVFYSEPKEKEIK